MPRPAPFFAPVFPPVFALAFALLAAAAAADPFCDDLWFSRNQLYARAGYCFASPLGKAVFGNAGCTGTEVRLRPGEAQLVAQVKALEAETGCKVDPGRTVLEVDNIALRLRLEVPVVRSEFASGCLGWTGGPLALLAGPDDASAPIARIETGDDIAWEYEAAPWPEGWSFLTGYRNGTQTALGWHRDIDQGLCTGTAG